MEVRVGLEWPAPRMQDTGKTGEVHTDETLVSGEPFEGESRGGDQGVGSEALRRAEAGSARLRHGEGEEDGRPGTLCLHVVGEPLRGGMMRTRRAMTMAPGMLDAVVSPPSLGTDRGGVRHGRLGHGGWR